MKGERLFQIIGLVDDDLIESAEVDRPMGKAMNKPWMKWTAAACMLLVIGSGIWYLINQGVLQPKSGQGGNGYAGGSTFMRYAGPILPLNASGNMEGITSSRATHFDFTPLEAGDRDISMTDSYKLTNSTSSDKTIEIAYPFISSISNSSKYAPALALNGKSLEGELIMGDYTGGFTGAYGGPGNATLNLAPINSWEGYKALLENRKYFDAAHGEKVLSDQSVTVYSFQDVTYPEEYQAATLAIEFDLPEGSKVMTYGINGSNHDGSNHYQYNYFVRHSKGQRIIIIGQPPSEYTVQGYENGACEKKIDGITCTVRKKTMMLSEVIKECMDEYTSQYSSPDTVSPLVTEELAYRAAVSMLQYTVLGDAPKDRYGWMMLDELISESYVMERVMYLKAQITIPAGRTIELESKFLKGPSYDFAYSGNDENKGVTGYDMMTKLGSNLNFTGQRASIDLPQTYKILRQNFGFDTENGINEVNLDTSQEHYYLEIK